MPVSIILSGCNGRMGRAVTDLAAGDKTAAIAAGVDMAGEASGGYPVYKSFDEAARAGVAADVIIDFSSPALFDGMLFYAVENGIPAVICTTGLSDAQLGALAAAAEKTALLRSANMSLGINLLISLLTKAAPVLREAGFDIEIVEKHHNQKKDAPSGTALALAEAVNASLPEPMSFVTDRSTRLEARPENEIGIHSLRYGGEVGTHEIIIATGSETITLKHEAENRALFGQGALAAAEFIVGKAPGMYDMKSIVE